MASQHGYFVLVNSVVHLHCKDSLKEPKKKRFLSFLLIYTWKKKNYINTKRQKELIFFCEYVNVCLSWDIIDERLIEIDIGIKKIIIFFIIMNRRIGIHHLWNESFRTRKEKQNTENENLSRKFLYLKARRKNWW